MEQYKEFSSPEEVNKWVADNYSKADLNYLNVVENSDSPLSYYKGNYYKIINKYLRMGLEEKQTIYDIVGIKAMIEQYKIPENLSVIRFIDIREFICLVWNTCFGKRCEYPCFLSTTLLRKYYAMDEIKRGRFTITILVSEGTPGIYIPEVNADSPEYEVLFPYRIKLKRISWRKYIIENEVI